MTITMQQVQEEGRRLENKRHVGYFHRGDADAVVRFARSLGIPATTGSERAMGSISYTVRVKIGASWLDLFAA